MQKDKILKWTYLFIVNLLVLCVVVGTANAQTRSNCTDSKSGSFTFSVEPAITITVTGDLTLQSLCPGCAKTYGCGLGPNIEFDVKGSLHCRYKWEHIDAAYASSDGHAGLLVNWYEWDGTQWIAVPITDPNPSLPLLFFDDGNGFGYGKYRAYVCSYNADCNATGTYYWAYTVKVDYVCPLQ